MVCEVNHKEYRYQIIIIELLYFNLSIFDLYLLMVRVVTLTIDQLCTYVI